MEYFIPYNCELTNVCRRPKKCYLKKKYDCNGELSFKDNFDCKLRSLYTEWFTVARRVCVAHENIFLS